MKSVTVIHCWSAPRSRSTALLYSFEARGEGCIAIDEPLYREWLIRKGDSVARPYFRELTEGKPPADAPEEADVWKRELPSLNERLRAAAEKLGFGGIIFCKHMAKHSFLYDFDQECKLENVELIHRHLLLIRDPVAVLAAWGKVGDVHGNNPTSDEVGIVPLLSIYSKLESKTKGQIHPVVVESDDLSSDPETTISNLCEGLSIPYKESMMSWKKGPHACDGPWAKVGDKLFANVNLSNGKYMFTSKASLLTWCPQFGSGGTKMCINRKVGFVLPRKTTTPRQASTELWTQC